MTNLTVLQGGKKKVTSHIFEVHDSEGYIVDVIRFDTPEEASEFQSGLVGEYYVKPHTLTVFELLEVVLDLRLDEFLEYMEDK